MNSDGVRKIRTRSVLPVAPVLATIIALYPGASHAAVSVTLECDRPDQSAHELLEIDYDASTIRRHFVNDDGGPATASQGVYTDQTFPVAVTDNQITWSDQWAAGHNDYTLGRLSGTLTTDMINTRTPGQSRTVRVQCHRWTPKLTERQF